MNRTLLKIKLLYENMGSAEKRVADWLLSHSNDILPFSITELADKTSSGEATIVRFAKRIGYSGYQELKISIAQEVEKKVANENITASDSCFDIFGKMINDVYISLEKNSFAE